MQSRLLQCRPSRASLRNSNPSWWPVLSPSARCTAATTFVPYPRPMPCGAAPSNGEGPSGSDGGSDDNVSHSRLRFNKRDHELPPELRGVRIVNGELVDERGEVINEFGASRWDVAVSALRGELDPPAWEDNTDRSHGLLMRSLVGFPSKYTFQVVGSAEGGRQALVDDVTAVISRICQVDLQPDAVAVKDRLGGKYVSISVDVVLRAPELVMAVVNELGKDERVKLKY